MLSTPSPDPRSRHGNERNLQPDLDLLSRRHSGLEETRQSKGQTIHRQRQCFQPPFLRHHLPTLTRQAATARKPEPLVRGIVLTAGLLLTTWPLSTALLRVALPSTILLDSCFRALITGPKLCLPSPSQDHSLDTQAWTHCSHKYPLNTAATAMVS